jgi:hypothetical protein
MKKTRKKTGGTSTLQSTTKKVSIISKKKPETPKSSMEERTQKQKRMFEEIINQNDKINIQSLKKYIGKGGDLNFKDSEGNTILHIVCILLEKSDFNYYNSIIRFLVEHGANVNEVNGNGNTPIHLLNMTNDKNYTKLLDYFIENNANIDIKNNLGLSSRMISLEHFLKKKEKNQERIKKIKIIEEFSSFIEKYNRLLEICNLSIQVNFLLFLQGEKTYFTKNHSYRNMSKKILLCLYNKDNNCISSLDIHINAEQGKIEFSSQTDVQHEGNKYNKLLRCVFFLFFVSSNELQKFVIHINSISRSTDWIMMNFFKMKSSDDSINQEFTDDKIKTIEEYNKLLDNKYGEDDEYKEFHFTIKNDPEGLLPNENMLEKGMLEGKMKELIKSICPQGSMI